MGRIAVIPRITAYVLGAAKLSVHIRLSVLPRTANGHPRLAETVSGYRLTAPDWRISVQNVEVSMSHGILASAVLHSNGTGSHSDIL